MILQKVQLTRQKSDHNLFILTLLVIKVPLALKKQKRTLFGLLLPLMVCTNVVYGFMNDKDFFHKEGGGRVFIQNVGTCVPEYSASYPSWQSLHKLDN